MKHTLLLLTLWVLTTTAVMAQHQIPRSVFGNGATTTSDGSFKIVGTLGQPAIGLMSTNDHTSLAGFWYTTFERATSIEQLEDEGLPRGFRLDQNYPNPFNPQTTIRYDVPEASDVRIVVYSTLGQEVRTLIADQREAGRHQVVWNGRDALGRQVATGVYLIRMNAGSFSRVQRVMLLK